MSVSPVKKTNLYDLIAEPIAVQPIRHVRRFEDSLLPSSNVIDSGNSYNAPVDPIRIKPTRNIKVDTS